MSTSHFQQVADWVGDIAAAKEEAREYELARLPGGIATVGACSRRSSADPYSAWTYFNSHRHPMDYPGFPAENLPIGSGVSEAACKSLVKQRPCASGMRWINKAAKVAFGVRALAHTVGRWTQFWQKIDQFGTECFG